VRPARRERRSKRAAGLAALDAAQVGPVGFVRVEPVALVGQRALGGLTMALLAGGGVQLEQRPCRP
jgi:hypothetical protein